MEPDAAFAALLADPRMAVRPCPAHVPLAAYRAAADGFMAAARGPAVGAVADLEAAGRPARLYRPAAPGPHGAILAIHGGGFVFGGLDTHDSIWRRLVRASGAAVLACTYRLAPEHPAPAAEQDCADALAWLTKNAEKHDLDPERIALFGDSAGGFLALCSAVHAAAAGRPPRHLTLAYPCLDPACESPSQAEFATGYLMTRAALRWFWRCYLGDSPAPALPVDALPRTLILTAACDPLRDEGEALAARLGERATLWRVPGMIHGFLGLPQAEAQASAALERVGAAIAAAIRSDGPGN